MLRFQDASTICACLRSAITGLVAVVAGISYTLEIFNTEKNMS